MFQEKFNIAYMGLHNIEIYKYGISFNKMYEYMYNELPILTGSFPETPVTKSQCGVFFENESVDSLVQAIRRAKAMPKDELVAIGRRGRVPVEEYYLYPKLAKKYIEIMIKPFR